MGKTFKKMRNIIMKVITKEDIYYLSQGEVLKNILEIPMCGITYPDKNYEIHRDNSRYSCLEYVEKGAGEVHIDDIHFYPTEGDSYFLHTGERHHYFSDKKHPWKKYFINIHGSLFDSLVEGYQLKNAYLFKGLNIKDELVEIINMAKENTVDNTEKTVIAVNKILCKMMTYVKENSSTPSLAEKMKDYLNMHISSKFKLKDLCEYISISESQTIRIFREAYGITPYAYILEKKIKLAKDMLINTNLPIKQIAHNLCFADEYYFSNVFKNKVGVSPRNYRNNVN